MAMKSEAWWKSYEKDWLMERYDKEIEGDMKKLKKIKWHFEDNFEVYAFFAILIATTLAYHIMASLADFLAQRIP